MQTRWRRTRQGLRKPFWIFQAKKTKKRKKKKKENKPGACPPEHCAVHTVNPIPFPFRTGSKQLARRLSQYGKSDKRRDPGNNPVKGIYRSSCCDRRTRQVGQSTALISETGLPNRRYTVRSLAKLTTLQTRALRLASSCLPRTIQRHGGHATAMPSALT